MGQHLAQHTSEAVRLQQIASSIQRRVARGEGPEERGPGAAGAAARRAADAASPPILASVARRRNATSAAAPPAATTIEANSGGSLKTRAAAPRCLLP